MVVTCASALPQPISVSQTSAHGASLVVTACLPFPFLRHEGRQQYDLLPPAKASHSATAHRIAPNETAKTQGAGPDDDAEPGRREADSRARPRHFCLAQDAVRPGLRKSRSVYRARRNWQ